MRRWRWTSATTPISFGRYFEVQNQSLVMSGYLGSIGFAFPASMGLWAAVGGERQVVAIAGDGGFGQYAMEFTTAVKYEMYLTLILLVNDQLGKISKEQRWAEYDVWQTSLQNPDFAEFAELSGGRGFRARASTSWTRPSGLVLTTKDPQSCRSTLTLFLI